MNSFGSAITLPRFLHLITSNDSSIGIKTLTLACARTQESIKLKFTQNIFLSDVEAKIMKVTKLFWN